MSAPVLDALEALTRTTPRSALHSAAQWYAANFGWRVFPLHSVRADGRCSCGEYPCGTDNKGAGKHPRTRSGCLDASADPDTIAAWWSRWPDANVGVATGRGLVVVDIDPGAGGDDGLVDLVRSLGALPETVECITGGGGRHFYLTAAAEVRNGASRLAPGVDVRGEGGYVVAPPSRHRSGRAYAWEASGDPEEVDPAPVPEAWLRAMTGAGASARARARTPDDPIAAGARNDTLTRVAGSLRAAGVGFDAMLAALLAENAARCVPPLEEREVRAIADSVHRYAPTHRDPGATLPVTPERADRDTRDRAYRAILGALELAGEHREALRRWGFGDADIARAGLRSLPVRERARLATVAVGAVGEELARRVPGVVRLEEHGRAWWSLAGAAGIVTPVADAAGRVVALLAGADALGGGYALESVHRGGPSAEASPHVPARARALLDAGARDVVVVVGALRAELAAAVFNVPSIGACDVTAWRAALDVLEGTAVANVAIALDGIAPRVVAERERRACAEAVRAAGRTPGRVDFKGHDGLDNFLSAHGRAIRGAQ